MRLVLFAEKIQTVFCLHFVKVYVRLNCHPTSKIRRPCFANVSEPTRTDIYPCRRWLFWPHSMLFRQKCLSKACSKVRRVKVRCGSMLRFDPSTRKKSDTKCRRFEKGRGIHVCGMRRVRKRFCQTSMSISLLTSFVSFDLFVTRFLLAGAHTVTYNMCRCVHPYIHMDRGSRICRNRQVRKTCLEVP